MSVVVSVQLAASSNTGALAVEPDGLPPSVLATGSLPAASALPASLLSVLLGEPASDAAGRVARPPASLCTVVPLPASTASPASLPTSGLEAGSAPRAVGLSALPSD